jgi:hypothetical protein
MEAEGVVAARHELAADLQPRSAREAFKQLSIAIPHGPDSAHFLGTSASTFEDAYKLPNDVVRRNRK